MNITDERIDALMVPGTIKKLLRKVSYATLRSLFQTL